jgi:hypothetical protein
MSFQGEVSTGCQNCTQNITFKIYNAATGGSTLWNETQSVTMSSRRFNVVLGSTTALNIAFDEQYYLGITIGTGTELTPRVKLTSAPYALRARYADNVSLADGSVTTGKLADGAVSNAKIASGISYSKLTGAPTSLPPGGSAGGDLAASYPNPTVAKLQGRAVSTTAPTHGQTLTWDSTSSAWVPGTAGGVPAGLMVISTSPIAPAGYAYTGTVLQGESSDSWATKSSSGFTSRYSAASAVVNGKIYVIGGFTGSSMVNINEEYDPATNSWSTKSSTGFTARAGLDATAVNGKIYALGGTSNGSTPLNTNEEYDPATDSWSTKSSTGFTSRFYLTVAAANGKIYALGGTSEYAVNALNTNEEYDPATDSWTTKSSAGFTPRQLHAAAAVGNRIYTLGGVNATGDTVISANEEYDPATDSWSTKSSTGFTPRGAFAAATANDRIYAMGGTTGLSAVGVNEEYDPATDSWTTKSSDGFTTRVLHMAAGVGNKIYTIGGLDLSAYSAVNTVEEYTAAGTAYYLMVKQ